MVRAFSPFLHGGWPTQGDALGWYVGPLRGGKHGCTCGQMALSNDGKAGNPRLRTRYGVAHGGEGTAFDFVYVTISVAP